MNRHDGGQRADQRRREVWAVNEVHLLAHRRLGEAHLLPPELLDVVAEPGDASPDLDVAETVGWQLRKARRVRPPKARAEHDVLVALVVRVEPFDEIED